MWDLRKHESLHQHYCNNGTAWRRFGQPARVVSTVLALGVRRGGESWLSHLLAVRLLPSYLLYLDLSFLIYKNTVISTFYSTVVKTECHITEGSNTNRQFFHL